jgi:predicted ATPase
MDETSLTIGILGPLRVVVVGVELRIASRKQRQLVAELALRRGRPVSREELLVGLWPDSDEQHGRDSMRHALWQLRRDLGPAAGMLHTDGGDLVFDRCVAVDVVEFERLAASQRCDDLRVALDLYRDDLCRELEGDQGAIEREQLRRLFVVTGNRLADIELNANRPLVAAEIDRRVLRHDPYHEETHRQLLQALAAAGDLAGVASHYRALGRTLRAELGVEPSQETRALYADLTRGATAIDTALVRPPGTVPSPSLVGRRDEYRQLVEALIDSIDQRGRVVHINGRAGSGKTRLLDELSRTATEHGFQVVRGRCVGVEGQLGYQVWLDALRPFVAEATDLPAPWPAVLASLLPDLAEFGAADPGQVAPQLERTRLFEGVARLLARLASRTPTLIALDDLHWADADALHLLHYLARNLREERITIVTAARPFTSAMNQALADMLNTIRSTGALLEVGLRPLDLVGVTALLEQAGLTRDTAGALGPRIVGWTDGNPFFVLEATRALVEQGSLRPDPTGRLEWNGPLPDESESLAVQLPRGVRETILARVDTLPADTRPILNIASAIGGAVAPEVLSVVSGRDEITILDLLTPPLTAGLLSETMVAGRPALMFIHDLVREAIYQQQPAIVRAAIHRRIAAALESLAAPSAIIAHHLTAAGESDRAAGHWLAAGEQATAVFAHEEAIRAFEQALATLPEFDRDRRVTALEKLAAIHVRRGSIGDALERYDQALTLLAAGDDADRRAHLWSRIGFTSGRYYGGHPRGLEYAEAAVAHYTARDLSVERCEALISLAFMRYQMFDSEAAKQAAIEAVALSRQLDRPHLEAGAYHALAWARMFAGDSVRTVEESDVEALIQRLGRDEDVAYLQYVLGQGVYYNGDLSLAKQHCESSLSLARQIGNPRSELLALELIAMIHNYWGEPDEAQQAAEEVLAIAARLSHDRHGSSVYALRTLAVAYGLRDDMRRAIEIAWQVHALDAPNSGKVLIHSSPRIDAYRVFLLAGRPDLIPELDELRIDRPACHRCALDWLAVAGQRQALSDDPAAALPIAQELEDQIRVAEAGLIAGWVPYIRAIALRRLGRIDEAKHQADIAQTAFQSIGHNWGLKMVARDLRFPAE